MKGMEGKLDDLHLKFIQTRNPWRGKQNTTVPSVSTSSNDKGVPRVQSEQKRFRNDLFKHYRIPHRGPSEKNMTRNVKCPLVPGKKFFPDKLRAAHIFPKHWDPEFSPSDCNLTWQDVMSSRNDIPMTPELESAFDAMRFCILKNPLHADSPFLIKILDPKLKNEELGTDHKNNSIKFEEIDGAECNFSHQPFKRALAYHAKVACSLALEREWMKKGEIGQFALDAYFNLSNDGETRQEAASASASTGIGPMRKSPRRQ